MAGDPIQLPQLADPKSLISQAKAAGTQQPAQRKPVSGLDAMVNTFASIEDPFARSLAKGLVETELSRAAGFKVSIPDPEDMEMMAAQKRIQLSEMRKQMAVSTIEETKAALLDLPPAQQAQLGLQGQDIDTLIESNPDLFVSAAQKAGITEMSRGMLSLGKIQDTDTASAGPAFQQKQAEQQVQTLQTQASGVEAAGKVAKATESGAFQEQAKAALKSSGEALGVDMDTFFDNPIDTDRGGVALADAAGTLLSQAGPAFAPMVAQGLLSAISGDVKDALEDEPAVNGQLVVGQGGSDISPRATFYVAATLLRVAKTTGQNIGDLMKQMDLGQFTGIEPTSFNAFLESEAKTAGQAPEAFAATLGL